MSPGSHSPGVLLAAELRQRLAEGCAVPAGLRRAIRERGECGADPFERAAIGPLYAELAALPPEETLAAHEPAGEEAIERLRPPERQEAPAWEPRRRELESRLGGAVTGFALGCALGLPPRETCLAEPRRPRARQRMREHLQRLGDWPLRDFFPRAAASEAFPLGCQSAQREYVRFLDATWETHGLLTPLEVFERHGPDFPWRACGGFWQENLPLARVPRSEARALQNLLDSSDAGEGGNADPNACAQRWNPYREDASALMRGAGWGLLAAGKPALAARFAGYDAGWTHARNGLYAARFAAALAAAAFSAAGAAACVEAALSEIPRRCRLAEAVRQVLEWSGFFDDFEACLTHLERAHAAYGVRHAITNTAAVVATLLYGEGEPVGAPALAVSAACDTTACGSLAGLVTGIQLGERAFTDTPAGELCGTLRTAFAGQGPLKFSEVCERAATAWRELDDWAGLRRPAPEPEPMEPVWLPGAEA